jgi:tetratricopeptide (TPR) repeat protein
MIVGLFGLIIDWYMSRNWRRVLLFLGLPVLLVAVSLVVTIAGSVLNKDKLADYYLQLGERELQDAETDWAFDLSMLAGKPEESAAKKKVGRFTESVFRRALELQNNNQRIQFVTAAILAQQGMFSQAIPMMRRLAPDKGQGYLPAHAWMASMMISKGQVPKEQIPLLNHHLQLGVKLDNAPPALLAAATQIALSQQDQAKAIDLLRQSAEKQPEYEAELLRLAIRLGNQRVAEQTAEKSLARLLLLVEEGKATADDRLALADVLLFKDDLDAARGAIETGLKDPNISDQDRQKLRRGLSELYRFQFNKSLVVNANNWTADIRQLDAAMRTDPTNPKVAEDVAKLARIGGDRPPDEMIKQLNDFLAKGVATPTTHAWLAETYILRTNYDKAIEHLRSLLGRMPDNAQAHNNLAFALALSDRTKLPEAKQHAQQAVSLSPSEADFHDTLGFILMQQDDLGGAIAEFELAIERAPQRTDFHEHAAEAYQKNGNQPMAEAHRKIIAELKQQNPSTPPSQEK